MKPRKPRHVNEQHIKEFAKQKYQGLGREDRLHYGITEEGKVIWTRMTRGAATKPFEEFTGERIEHLGFFLKLRPSKEGERLGHMAKDMRMYPEKPVPAEFMDEAERVLKKEYGQKKIKFARVE